ncbi:hypothetical protein Tco_0952369, partial [Tanacetum coccineum]
DFPDCEDSRARSFTLHPQEFHILSFILGIHIVYLAETDIREKDKKKAKNDQTKHGMKKTKSNRSQIPHTTKTPSEALTKEAQISHHLIPKPSSYRRFVSDCNSSLFSKKSSLSCNCIMKELFSDGYLCHGPRILQAALASLMGGHNLLDKRLLKEIPKESTVPGGSLSTHLLEAPIRVIGKTRSMTASCDTLGMLNKLTISKTRSICSWASSFLFPEKVSSLNSRKN